MIWSRKRRIVSFLRGYRTRMWISAEPALTFHYECVVSALATEAPVRHPNPYHQLSSRGSRGAPRAKRTAVPCASQGGGIWTEMKSAGATRWTMAHGRSRIVSRRRSDRMIVCSIISRLRPCCCSSNSSCGLSCAPATRLEKTPTRRSKHRATTRRTRSARCPRTGAAPARSCGTARHPQGLVG